MKREKKKIYKCPPHVGGDREQRKEKENN